MRLTGEKSPKLIARAIISSITILLMKPRTYIVGHLKQLCPTRSPHAAQSKVLCDPVQVSAAVKVGDREGAPRGILIF